MTPPKTLSTHTGREVMLLSASDIPLLTASARFWQVERATPTPVEEAIHESKWIPSLDPDWDDNSAKSCAAAWTRAVRVLRLHATLATRIGEALPPPLIRPVADGSVDMQWTLLSADVLVNVPGDTPTASYYCDDRGENRSQGTFNVEFPEKALLFWLVTNTPSNISPTRTISTTGCTASS